MANCFVYNQSGETYNSNTIGTYRPICERETQQITTNIVQTGGGSPGEWTVCVKTTVRLKNCLTGPDDSIIKNETIVPIKAQNPILKNVPHTYIVKNIRKV